MSIKLIKYNPAMTNIGLARERNFSMDVLRVLACILVMWQHASEYYYIGPNLSVVREAGTYVLGFINSASRICVPLFVMISGYFLLPMKGTTGDFFKKRFTRILFPFLFWCVAYAVYYVFYNGDLISTCLTHVAHIFVNYGVEVGHLWYVYMLIGLYLIIPIISPWLASCSKKELQIFLGIWVVTGFIPYIHVAYPLLWGEASWNPTPMLYYFTGFAGYLVLGYYVKKFGALSVWQSVALFFAGFIPTVLIFNNMIATAPTAVELELGWSFCGTNVMMMTFAIFCLVSHIPQPTRQSSATKLIADISVNSYAIYLAHIMVLNFYHKIFDGIFNPLFPSNPTIGLFHLSWDPVLLEVPAIALSTFITVALLVKLCTYLPKTKYWFGA